MTPEDLGAVVADDHTDALRQESEKIAGKIDEAYGKLASKLRGKADKAKSTMETKTSAKKRALLRRRFELYADAANALEMRAAERRGSDDGKSD
ncbi:hypothetical protein [Methylobacterium sp. PvR107]|uniref:hypothetical protein n=1 Tax=Methylobacterium sp. PvR107 TaxID=2806597 RepID=UPI001AE7E212|nr:hypothetical protein [Methylobacterium sp. PvR107]MBP1183664.1 uncharacterized protein YjbJ (UPF0337 family) [Methylobacterium sp. PvR107]